MPNRFALWEFALCIVSLRAWSPPHHSQSHSRRHARSCRQPEPRPRPLSIIFLAPDEGSEEELIQDNTNKESTVVYGVSYIGGDPCGSKYNNDPFDASNKEDSFKPGLPDDMKDRIAALAAKKLQEQRENEDDAM